ncbi:glycoside hydrolase [Corynascus novoguineensis]|uniref:Glycoside hydrolase n=1 Tax=Corynascus novoguineensis TaxID=1126955 RepID=A0AAN7CPH4_9PEZI|nr:glycoside hydrolase [Corynascus novoguineensis]
MIISIATSPPLGQVTQLPNSDLTVHAVLEIPLEASAKKWQVALWYSKDEREEWEEAELAPITEDARPTDLHEPIGAAARLYFTTKLVVRSLLKFTVKFRQGTGDREWRWARSEQGLDDGVVIVDQNPTREDDREDLPDMIHDLNPELKWKSHMSQSPGTRLWAVETDVDGAKEGESAFVEVSVGIPWGGRYLRWFALVRSWTPWLAPRHGKSEFSLDKEGLLCSFLSFQGKHLVLLGMSGINDVTALLRSGSAGRLLLSLRSDNVNSTTGTVLVAVGDNLENAIAAVMYHARTLVTATDVSSPDSMAAPTIEGGDVRPLWYERWYDGLGYCTWNSLGQKLTEEKILSALDTLAENGINISNLIIDDNWQDIDYCGDGQWQHGWNDFEAEPTAFPRGLKALVSAIRSKHRNIQHIAVWHALLGYWGGLAPSGRLAKRYDTVQVRRDDAQSHLSIDSVMTVVASSDVQAFYDDFYAFLASCGVDGVKTDAQYMLDTLTQPAARRGLTRSYLDAWTSSTLRHLAGGPAIACMAQAPPILFHPRLLRTNLPPVVCRTSDDFVPTDGDGNNNDDAHRWHVWTNAHNALLAQHLNALPDWDMFQTSSTTAADGHAHAHDYGGFHAAARCVSGGLVCITDVPGQHDGDLLRQIAGTSPRRRGRNTIVFRPSVVGRALDAYGSRADGGVLKVGTYHGRAGTGTGIIGVFNVDPTGRGRVTEVLPLGRFPGVGQGTGGGMYVVRAHRNGKVTPPLKAGSPSALVTVSLGVGGWDVLCAYPLHAVQSRTRGEVMLANLGLVGKMTGCATVLRTVFEVRENGRMLVDATLKALGVLGVYISALPELSVSDDCMVTIQGQPIPPHTVSVNRDDEHVLDVDIEAAWNEMDLKSGWANEVQVKVYFALEKK